MKLYYVTFPDADEAKEIADQALDKQLAACIVSFDAESRYVWEGENVEENEVVALFKTSESNASEFVTWLNEEHSYDVPCILELDAASTKDYDLWVHEATDGIVDRSNDADETVTIRFDVGPIFTVPADKTVSTVAAHLLETDVSDSLSSILEEIILIADEYGPEEDVAPVMVNGSPEDLYTALDTFSDDEPVHITLR